jgi:predicted DNA-binding protein
MSASNTDSERQNVKLPTGTLERLNLVRWHYGKTQYAMIDEALARTLREDNLTLDELHQRKSALLSRK